MKSKLIRKSLRKSLRKSNRNTKKFRKSLRKSTKNTKKIRKSLKGGMHSTIKDKDKNLYKNLYKKLDDFKNIPKIERELTKKIQYVFVNSHGTMIDTNESIAIKNPKSLIPKQGPEVNKRILTNSFCGTLDYNVYQRKEYMTYLLNLYQEEDGLDVLWSFTDKQEEKFHEIDNILFPNSKKYTTPLTHLGRTSSEKYFFTYDKKFQEKIGETFGIFLFTKFNKGYNGIGDTPMFEDLTEDIYEYIHGRKIYKIYSDTQYNFSKRKEPVELDFVLKRQRPYGYSESLHNPNIPVILTSDDIIRYFEEKHNTIVRIISGACRGSPKKRLQSMKYSMNGKVIPLNQGTKIPSDVGPLFENNVTRTISGVKNNTLDKYVVPGRILIILIDANGNKHRLELNEGSNGQELVSFVEKNLNISPQEQYYFANIKHFESQIFIPMFVNLNHLYMFKYSHNRVNIKPYTMQKPIYIYILNYNQYYDIFNEQIPNKLYPTLPNNLRNDPKKLYPGLYSKL